MKLIDFLESSYLDDLHERQIRERYGSINAFIYDDKRCYSIIHRLLDLGRIDVMFPPEEFRKRSIHILITYLFGLGISKKISIIDNANAFNELNADYLWVIVAIAHDYGYLRDELLVSPDLCVIDEDDLLLSDGYGEKIQLRDLDSFSKRYNQYMTYSYETIRDYYTYSKAYHSNGTTGETVDHGILGGCLCLQKYSKFFKDHVYPRYCVAFDGAEGLAIMDNKVAFREDQRLNRLYRDELLMYKAACLVTAQHNMFKSSSAETDETYMRYGLTELLSDKPVAVTKSNPLLMLLSIVDTIECTKRFYDSPIGIKDILETIDIALYDCSIRVDFGNLKTLIEEKCSSLLDRLKRHINAIETMPSWIECGVKKDSEYCLTVTI